MLSKLTSLVVPPWMKVALKLAPYALIVVLLAGLLATRSTLHTARDAAKLLAVQTQLASAQQSLSWQKRLSDKQSDYSQKLESFKPIILHNTETVEKYAKTPEGASTCLTADRVRGIAETRRALEATPPPAGG